VLIHKIAAEQFSAYVCFEWPLLCTGSSSSYREIPLNIPQRRTR